IELIKKICIDLKQMKPDCEILLGGPEVSYDPQNYDFADVVVCGEGEITVPEYLLGKISGKILQGSPVPLDKLSFCYSDEDLEENKHRLIYYESSRGCPYACSYCLSSIEKGIRFKSIERVCEELKRFDDAKVDLVKFVDRTFNADRKRAMKIWKFAAQECKHTKFHFELAGELLQDEDLEFLKTVPVGKFQFEIGIQSTNERTLKAVDRNGNLSLLFDRIRCLLSVGNIHVHTDLIVGMPFESYEVFKQSFNDVYSLHSDCLQVGFLKLLKGSKIRKESEQFHYRYSVFAPYEIYDNEFISSSQVFRLEMIAETVERFYNSHAFDKSIEYMISKFESPFDFYELFSKEFDHRGAVAQKKLYEIFYLFHLAHFGEDQMFSEWLRYDWIKQTKGVSAPDYLGKHQSIQPLLFQLLEEKEWKDIYLPDLAHMKNKDIVKRICLAKFHFSSVVYCLFYGDDVIDVTDKCEEINGKS
ncbi:MAG: DUF4080 domain-containing protein, partial [Ruminococcaceae bacterium]|nr:DUF4080 domain-containing protein [Oscillospiraceae bacterium]